MPTAPTYPGVYIEEIPSGVRTITGVATSITAFLGRAERGPVDEPVTINCFGDFERILGGLWPDSAMGFAVRDFYQNGGSQAIIVRLFEPTFATEADRAAAAAAAQSEGQTAANAVADAAAGAVATAGTAQEVADAASAAVAAASGPGTSAASAAEAVAAAATDAVSDTATPQSVATAASNAVADAVAAAVSAAAPFTNAKLAVGGLSLVAAYPGAWGNALRARVDHDVAGPDAASIFNLSVKDGDTKEIEVFRNLSVDANHPRYVTNVLSEGSRLLHVDGATPGSRPTESGTVQPGADPFAETTSSGVTTMASDGQLLSSDNFTSGESEKRGIYALEKADLFNLLCIPPYNATGDVDSEVWTAAATYCEDKRRAMLLVDSPRTWSDKDKAKAGITTGVGTTSKNAVLFFPQLRQRNPLKDNQFETFAACGAVAGVFARTDAQRGVWKAPAGLAATLRGVPQLSVSLTDMENGELNPLGINCLMVKPPAGRVVWGARTLQGDDRFASEWKYTPVRRTALFIEESLFRGTHWAVFEPNDEPLWAELRLNIGAFMQNLFRQGAFQGTSPRDAYFVKCDKESTTQNDINLGIVNIVVGFAPLKPAEFVIIKIQQMAGQIET